MPLPACPVYLILTKSDLKSEKELESTKQYIKGLDLPIKDIICVSAKNDKLDELYTLIAKISGDKENILNNVNKYRVKLIAAELYKRVSELITHSDTDNELEDLIHEKENQIKTFEIALTNIVNGMQNDIDAIEHKTVREFYNHLSSGLDNLVINRGNNFDAQAVSLINNTSFLLLDEYKDKVAACFKEKIESDKKLQDYAACTNLDLSSYTIQGGDYTLKLDGLGHEYDKHIAFGLEVGAMLIKAFMTSGASSVEDIGKKAFSIINNAGKNNNSTKIVESVVGFATEELIAKPQRQYAVQSYINTVLLPKFRKEMHHISSEVLEYLKNLLQQNIRVQLTELKDKVKELRNMRMEQENLFTQKIQTYKDYLTYLNKYKEETK